MSIFNGKDFAELPVTEIRGMTVAEREFIKISSTALYERIIYAVIKEVQTGGKDTESEVLTLSASDNYTPFSRGFVYFLSTAMAEKRQIWIKKEKAGNQYIFSKTDSSEVDQPDVIELDFRKFTQATLLNQYYAILFDALNGAAKGVKISQGLLLKINRLSEMLADKRIISSVENQLNAISDALREAKTAYLDAGSSAEFASFDTEPSEKAITFVYQLISNLTGYSTSFVKGEKSGSSLSDSGEADKRQNREATEFYFNSIVQSVLEAIFGKMYKLKPNLDNIENLPSMLATIEMWGEGSDEGKRFLYEQIGLSDQHLDLSNKNKGVE